MTTDLSPFQTLGHSCERSLEDEGRCIWLVHILILCIVVLAVRNGLDNDVAASCFAGMLFIQSLFVISAQLAKSIDRLAYFFRFCIRLSESPKLFKFHVLTEYKLPPVKLVRLFILPPPAAPSLITV